VKKAPLGFEPSQARGWLSVKTAAEYLDMSPDALRRTLERHAVRAPDGGVEANVDGIRARKFGRLWRIQFSSRWSSEATP